jgi:hypothetical protein
MALAQLESSCQIAFDAVNPDATQGAAFHDSPEQHNPSQGEEQEYNARPQQGRRLRPLDLVSGSDQDARSRQAGVQILVSLDSKWTPRGLFCDVEARTHFRKSMFYWGLVWWT